MNISIKAKVILVVFVSLSLAASSIIYFINNSYNNNINIIAEQSLKIANESFNNLEKNDAKMLSAAIDIIISDKEIQEVFASKNREKLIQLTTPLYKTLKERYGITHWYFLNTEDKGTCFLRVHKPARFDDVVKRKTYINSIATKGFGVGKELGKTAFALRVVHPFTDSAGKLMGYIELGEEIDHFIDLVKIQSGNEITMLISKQFLDEKEWGNIQSGKGLKNNWGDLKDMLVVGSTYNDKTLVNADVKLEDISDNGVVMGIEHQNNKYFTKGIIPVYDANKTKVGGLLILKDITPLYVEMSAAKQKTILVVMLLVAVLCGIIIMILNNLIFKRLAFTMQVLTRVVGGDFTTRIPVTADDEIGKFESLLESFRNLFINSIKEFIKE